MQGGTKTKHILFGTLGGLVLAAGLYGWLIAKVWDIRGSLAQLSETIDARAQEEIHLRTTEDLLDATEEERAKLDSYFVTSESVVTFIETVEELGKAASVSVTTASVEEVEGIDSRIGSVDVRVSVVGAWHNVMHFLVLAEALPYATNITGMEMAQAVEAHTGVWQSSFTLQTALVK